MKGRKVLILVSALLLLGLPIWAGGSSCGKAAAVEVQVENLANGVKLTLTSQDPQMVAKLQAQGKVCGPECKKCPFDAEGVNLQEEKIENGVVMTATSNNQQLVKAVQAHAADMASKAKGMDHAKGSHMGGSCSKGAGPSGGCAKGSGHKHS